MVQEQIFISLQFSGGPKWIEMTEILTKIVL